MRATVFICLIAGSAGAHTLPGEQNPAAQLTHLLLAGHHLPLALLALFAAVTLIRRHRRNVRQRRQ